MMKTLLSLLTSATFALFATSSAMADATWNGGSGNWSDASSWTPVTYFYNGTPGAVPPGTVGYTGTRDYAFINSGSGTITIDADRNINAIDINNYNTGPYYGGPYSGGQNAAQGPSASTAGAYTFVGGPILLTGDENYGLPGGSLVIDASYLGTNVAQTVDSTVLISGNYGQGGMFNSAADPTAIWVINGNVSAGFTISNAGLELGGSNTGANIINGVISNGDASGGSSLALDKIGTGNWILAGANTFSGETDLKNGTLQLNNFNALQYSQVLFQYTAAQTGPPAVPAYSGTLTFGSAGTYKVWSLGDIYNNNNSGNESLPTGVVLQMGTAIGLPNLSLATYTYNGVLSGAGGITQKGQGINNGGQINTQVFTGNNTYSGPTTIVSGALQSTLSTSGTPFGTGTLVFTGGSLQIEPSGSGSIISDTAASAHGSTISYNSGGALFLNKGSNTSLTLTVGDGTHPVFAGTGTGTLIIETNSADMGTGENVVINGTAPALSHGIITPTILGVNGATFYGNYLAGQLSFLTYGVAGTTGLVAATSSNTTGYLDHSTNFTPISGEISNVTGDPTVTPAAGANPYALRISQSGYDGSLTIAAGDTLTVGDGTNPAAIILNSNNQYGPEPATLINAGNSASTLNFGTSEGLIDVTQWAGINTIVAGTNGITLSGVGQSGSNGVGGGLTFQNNNNTFSGGITVNSGAVLAYDGSSNGNHFRNGTLGDPNNTITLNGGTLSNGFNYGASFVGVDRSVILTSLGGTLAGAGNYVANISGSGQLSMGSNFADGNNPYYYGNTFQVLSGNNTFTGGLLLYNNYTQVASEANLGAATSPITFDGGYIAVAGANMHDFGSHPLEFVPGVGVGLDIEDPANTFTLSQVLSQSTGGFSKMGSGTLVLTGAETYLGTTAVYGGTLVLDESQGGSISSQSGLYFDGGTLHIIGNTTGSTVQSFNGLSMGINTNTSDATSGGGTLIVDSNTGTGTTTVNLGTLNLANNSGSGFGSSAQTGNTLDIAVTGSGTSTVTTTSAPDSTGTGAAGIYGARIVYTTASGTDWASSTSAGPTYTLSAYTAYDDFDPQLVTFTGNNILLDATNSGYFGGDSFTKNLSANTVKIDANSSTNTVLDLSGFKLTLTGGGLLFTGTNDFTIQNGTLVSGLTGTGQANGQNGDDLIIQDYSTTNKLTISATIADGTTGASTLTKAGPGTLILSGTNSYTGQTFINGGTLSVSTLSNLGSSPRININGGTFQVGSSFVSPQIYLGPSGGTIDVLDGSTLDISSEISTATGGGNAGASHLTIASSDGSNGVTWLDYHGNLNGNIFYGGITIDSGTLRLSGYASNDTGDLGTTPANYISWGSGSTGTLQLNGYYALVAGLESTSANAIVEDGNGSNSNSLLGVSTGDNETFAGRLINNTGVGGDTGTGTLSFLKMGAGTLSLTNANSSYTGTTEIDGGTLNVASLTNGGVNSSIGASPNVASSLVFGGGTLQYTGSTAQSTDRLFTLGDAGVGGNSGAIDASGSTGAATVTFSNTNPIAFGNIGTHTLTLTGTNSGSGSGATANLNTFAPLVSDSSSPTSVTKSDTGSWAITNGSNSYSGGTSVTAGTLFVDNATGSGTGSSAVTVDGGTLSGTGQIAPSGTHGITVTAVGTVAPGGVQATVPITGTPGTQAYGNLTLGTTSFTGGGPGTPTGTGSTSPLVTLNSANLTFALGAGTTTVVNGITGISENTTGSKLIIGGTAPNTITFTGESVVTINDLVGAGLSLHQEYMLIQGNGFTTYDTGAGSSLVVSTTFTPNYGYAITGGITLLQSAGNFYSAFYQGSTLFLNGDNIDVAVIPEPSTWALLLGGAGLLVFLRRRANRVRAD